MSVALMANILVKIFLDFGMPVTGGVFTHSELTLSWRRSLFYRDQSTDLQSKSVDWFLYDRYFCHEKIKERLQLDWTLKREVPLIRIITIWMALISMYNVQ